MESNDPKRPSRSLNVKPNLQIMQMQKRLQSQLIAILFSFSLRLTGCKKGLQTEVVVMFQPKSLQTVIPG